MIQAGFLDPESRRDLIKLARDGLVPHRLARRANALVLLDQGMSCGAVAQVLFLDDDTIRTWYRLYQQDGFDGLVSFGYDDSACRLSEPQQDKLKAWITETLPRTTAAVGVRDTFLRPGACASTFARLGVRIKPEIRMTEIERRWQSRPIFICALLRHCGVSMRLHDASPRVCAQDGLLQGSAHRAQ